MEELVFSLDLTTLFLLAAGVFSIYYFTLKRYIFFWFDPLLFYLVFNSCSTAFVLYLYFWERQISTFYLITFVVSTVGFMTGLFLGSKLALKQIVLNKQFNTGVTHKYNQVFDIFLIISIVIVVGSNLLMLVVVGSLPILSANPSEAKIDLYTGGWGLVRRIDLVSVNFIFAVSLLKLYHPVNLISLQKKLFYWLCILIGIGILFTMGAKGSLINILNTLFGVALINAFFKKGNESKKTFYNIKSIKNFGKYALLGAVCYMFFVITKSGVETTAFNTFITRMVAAGDTFYFFYVYDMYKDFKVTTLDFFTHIANPILGFLRITPYEYPVGAYMLYYAFGSPLGSLGPNAQHHIEGLLYFGKYGAVFYSLAVGFMIAFLRLSLLNRALKKPNFLRLLIFTSLASIAISAAVEFNWFLLLFYDVLIFGTLQFLLSLAIMNYLRQSKIFQNVSS